MSEYKLYHGNCLDILPRIADASVDAIIADMPFGKTACIWDKVILFDPMWHELKRVIKPRSAIVLFGQEPFASRLRLSNETWYKYDTIWDKERGHDPQLANVRPMMAHEYILVFGIGRIAYYPQKTIRVTPIRKTFTNRLQNRKDGSGQNIFSSMPPEEKTYYDKFPTTVIRFGNHNQGGKLHPTEKPVLLLEYLVKTYTQPDNIVLDFTMGSGSTGEACLNTGRSFIGIELYPLLNKPIDTKNNPDYFGIAQRRLESVAAKSKQLDLIVS